MSDRWKSFLLLAFSVLLVIGVAEVVARVVIPIPQRVVVQRDPGFESRLLDERTYHREYALPVHPEQGGIYIETKTGRRLRANTRVVIENHALNGRRIEISTNSLGYRNPEIGPKQKTRILFLGDSITFADYLPEEETFVRIIERDGTRMGMAWETINAGVGAISLENELSILIETGLAINPDAVVLCFYLNDFFESPGVLVPRLPRLVERSRILSWLWLTIGRQMVQWDVESLSQESRDFDPGVGGAMFLREHPVAAGDRQSDRAAFNEQIAKNFRDWGGAWSPVAWELITPLIAELMRLSQKHDFKLYIVAFPVRQQVEAAFLDDYPQQRLREVAGRLGISFLDLLPPLRAAWRAKPGPLFFDQCHQTPVASVLVARWISDFLFSNGLR